MSRGSHHPRDDEKLLQNGLDPFACDPLQLMALSRRLYDHVEEAKRAGRVDPLMGYLYGKWRLTRERLNGVPIACAKGCAYCCHVWVEASAPEVFMAYKAMRRSEALNLALTAAYQSVGGQGFDKRIQVREPCPMLKDQLCGIYSNRPIACRGMVSADVEKCRRSFEGGDEEIPTPFAHHAARSGFWISLSAALKRAGLSHNSYDLVGGLNTAREVEDGERRWLAGEDIFSDVECSPVDILASPINAELFQAAFQ